MRCKFCGSTSLHPDTQHKTFSTGKAVAGAVMFGAVGAAAGFIGKDQNGYRCGSCGAFMDSPMDSFTEIQVNGAIREAESGGRRALYDYYKGQYPNIQASIPSQPAGAAVQAEALPAHLPTLLPAVGDGDTIKRSYRYGVWEPDCPIYVESVILYAGDREDRLSLIAWNQSGKTLRSVYFTVRVRDDTGDEVANLRCAYQNLSVPGDPEERDKTMLPAGKQFPLGTDLAYRVELTCEKVAFEGDEVWRAPEESERIALPEQALLTAQNFPRIKYIRTRYARQFREPRQLRLWIPVEGENFWLCDCGHPAAKGQLCPYCGDRWERVEPAFDQKTLRKLQQNAVKQRAARRAEKTWPLYEAAVAEKARKEEEANSSVYAKAEEAWKENTTFSVREARSLFLSLGVYRDAADRAEACRIHIQELEAKRLAEEKETEEKRLAEEQAAKKKKRIAIIVSSAVAGCLTMVLLLVYVVVPNINYNKAKALIDAGKYEEAIVAFEALDGYKDSAAQITAAKNTQIEAENAAAYEQAEALLAAGDYNGAIAAFQKLRDYRDSAERVGASMYERAESLLSEGRIIEAAKAFYDIKGYKDSRQRACALWETITARDTIAAGGLHTVGLKADGTVVAGGVNGVGQCNVSDWTDIVAIATGVPHTVGLKADGTVVAVGNNHDGECNVSGWKDIVAIAAGDYHTVGLKADGTVVAVGYEGDGLCNVSGWKDIVAIAAGGAHTVGLKADGTVVAVGNSYHGQCNVSSWTDVVAIAAGGRHTVGLKADGTVVATGYDGDGQCSVSTWTDIVAIAAGDSHTVGLKADGTVVAAGLNDDGRCNVSGWRNIVAISAGMYHTVGLRADGTVLAVGGNNHGQYNVSGWRNIKLPKER